MQIHATCLALLLLSSCVSALIIPEELVSLLSIVYSNIPPIRKGTDSRVGVGFRLGNSADVQFVVELGPQVSTQPLGPQRDTSADTGATASASSTSFKRHVDPDVTNGGNWLSKWRANIERRNATEMTATGPETEVAPPVRHPNRILGEPMLLHLRRLYRVKGDREGNNTNDSNAVVSPIKKPTVESLKSSAQALDDVSLGDK